MDESPSTSRPADDDAAADAEVEQPVDGADQATSVRGSGVPPVVIVLVTRDRGPRLAETLHSIEEQEYANLSVLVVDAGSEQDPAPLVADILPAAFVRRAGDVPWAEAANSVIGSVEGAAFLLFLHDDVALGPGSVQALVEEAFRANAGIVGPKLVEWDNPDVLSSIGVSVDRFGFSWPIAEPGELDQSQHDAAREVFSISGATLLIRADLFNDVGGFSTDIDGAGEDLDLCWRAKVAGGRTVIMPAARVRHSSDSGFADPEDPHRVLTLRHQVRVALACYSPMSLARVVPQSLALIPGDIVLSLLGGRAREARSIVSALGWNVAHLPTTFRIHSRVSRSRRIQDSEIKKLQLTGSARIAALTRGTAEGSPALSGVGGAWRSRPEPVERATSRWVYAVWVALAALILLGSRSLLADGVPAIREFLPFADTSTMWSEWWSGWRTTGVGAAIPAPSLLGAVGAVTSVVWFDGLVRTLLFLGPLLWGAVALWRLFGPQFSAYARVAALVAYCLNPLPYNAIAEGRWQALVVYAAMPALLSSLFGIGGWEPFAPAGAVESTVRSVGRLALVLVVATAVAPVTALVALGVVALIALAVAATPRGGAGNFRRTVVGLVVASFLAFMVHLPWGWAVATSPNRWNTLVGSNGSAFAPVDLTDALRFDTGPAGGALGLALWIAPLVAVAVARGPRFRWAILSVALSATGLAMVVLAGRLAPDAAMPATEVLLAPAVTGIALGAAMCVKAFLIDVSGTSFSWRQIFSGVALVALAIGTLPMVGRVADGRWGAPAGDIEASFAAIADDLGAQRTLRLGHPDVIGGRGWSADEAFDFVVTDGANTSLTDLFPHGELEGERAIRDALDLAATGETTRLGALLAPSAIDYVVVVDRLAPLPYGIDTFDAGSPLPAALAQQIDLQRVEVVPGLEVYRNTAAMPRRGAVDAALGEGFADLSAEEVVAKGAIEATPVLEDERSLIEYSGPVPGDSSILVADNRDDRWSLTVDGEPVERSPAFRWASRYDTDGNGEGVLARDTPATAGLAHLVQALALLAVFALTAARPWRPRRPTRNSR